MASRPHSRLRQSLEMAQKMSALLMVVLAACSAGSSATPLADGHQLWSYDTHSAVRSGPALAGADLVVVGDYAGDVLAFRPNGAMSA
jgi:hypothetical protein